MSATALCVIGLQQPYGLNFLHCGGSGSRGNRRRFLFSTDPNIALKNYLLLEDDKRLQLANSIAPVIRNLILQQSPEVRTLLYAVTSKLTTPELTDMNKQLSIDHKDGRMVAKGFLQANALVH